MKLYWYLLSLILTLILVVVFIANFWILYSVLSERSGFYGNIYSHYNIEKELIITYLVVNTIFSLAFIVSIFKSLSIKKNKEVKRSLHNSINYLLIFILLTMIISHFQIPKG